MFIPIIAVEISKEEILQKKFQQLKKLMNHMEKDPTFYRQTVVLHVSGYDDIPDELYEIEEVRSYFKRVFREFPYLLYFINTTYETWYWLILCLSDDMNIFYEGEVVDADTYSRKLLAGEPLPRKDVFFKLTKDKQQQLITATRRFAAKHHDSDEGEQMVRRLQALFQKSQ